MVKQTDFGIIVHLKDIWVSGFISGFSKFGSTMVEIITLLFSALVRCHVENIPLRAMF